MPEPSPQNPAEQAAAEAMAALTSCLASGNSFLLEAGAGAGKTHSLVKALEFLLDTRSQEYRRRGQRIACITYTNVASQEIDARTGQHPAVFSSTIHAFCWSLLKDFPKSIRAELPTIGKWADRIAGAEGGLGSLPIEYDLGYPAIRGDRVQLGHSDIVPLTVRLLESEKFRKLLSARYPVLFIDEYQDTNADFADALKRHFLDTGQGPMIGFFGDRWQKIYGDGCGGIEHDALRVISKGANFRSTPAVVGLLNAMRPELVQAVRDPDAGGIVTFYHANDWSGTRRTDGHSKGDLPVTVVSDHLAALRQRLTDEGWDLTPGKLKILMLTHRSLAAKQNYEGVLSAFDRNESWSNKEDPAVKFFADVLEPAFEAFSVHKYGEMFAAIGRRVPSIRKTADKLPWVASFQVLAELRETGTVGAVLRHLSDTKKPRLPEAVQTKWDYLVASGGEEHEDESSSQATFRKLCQVPYREMKALVSFVSEHTPFETQHGVKGAEFENVIVVFGRGWNQYDFNGMLEWWSAGIPKGKEAMYERSRNLFYVACSRPRKRLAVLFTQELSPASQATVGAWIGEENVKALTM